MHLRRRTWIERAGIARIVAHRDHEIKACAGNVVAAVAMSATGAIVGAVARTSSVIVVNVKVCDSQFLGFKNECSAQVMESLGPAIALKSSIL